MEELERPIEGFGERHFGCESVDTDLDVCGLGCDFCSFLIACGGGDRSLRVAIDRHALYVEQSAADAVVDFVFLPYSHSERVAHESVGIESANGVSATH